MIIAASLAFLRWGSFAHGRGGSASPRESSPSLRLPSFLKTAIGLWILVVSGLLFARGARDVPTPTGAVAP
jgi:hypothetical protein